MMDPSGSLHLPSPTVPPSEAPVQKEKKRRNRQRLSCTECTKRRQKCDRQRPCGLCTSRGVTHLCRWESDFPKPPAGPSYSSPDVGHSQTPQLLGTIDQLKARIAALEDTLQRTTTQAQATSILQHNPPFQAFLPPSAPPGPQNLVPPPTTILSHLIPIPTPPVDNVYATAINLATTSLVSGAGEYIGHGTIVCTVHQMTEGEVKFPFVQSTALYSRQPPHAQSIAISNMLQRLPPKQECDLIILNFFAHHNWRFGVPEATFRQNCESMWAIITSQDTLQVNPHWLGLLFSVLAFATTNSIAAPEFFCSSITARRIAEDMLLAPAFSPVGERKIAASADGAALSCLAAVLQATYLGDRGMVSEGWKLVGSALRSALAIGMHRDPTGLPWLQMSDEEMLLRRRSWWSLIIFDRFHSYILGRPSSIRSDQFDVQPPNRTKEHSCPYSMYEEALVKLSNVVDEAHRTCLGILSPSSSTVNEVDGQFAEWEATLQTPFRWRLNATPEDLRSWGSRYSHRTSEMPGGTPAAQPDQHTASHELTVLRQRHTLATWFLACRIILHRQFMVPFTKTDGSCIRNLGQGPSPMDRSKRIYNKKSEGLCFDLCLELCAVQVAGHGMDSPLTTAKGVEISARKVLPGKISGFLDSFFLFDCAVSLMLCLCSFTPGDPRSRVAVDAVERAGNIVSRLARTTPNDPQGDISRRAIAVLLVLRRYHDHLAKSLAGTVASQSKGTTSGSPQHQTSMEVDTSLAATSEGSTSKGKPASRPSSSVSTPSSYERYSRYLDTTASASITPSSSSSTMLSSGSGETEHLPDFSFLNSFSFPEDAASALRQFSSPAFDWGADWSYLGA